MLASYFYSIDQRINKMFVMIRITLIAMAFFGLSCSSPENRSGTETALPDESTLKLNTVAAITETGEHFFSGLRGLVLTSDGELLVNDRGYQGFLLFDPNGNYKSKVGNEGRGPGEFADIRHFVLTPDDNLHVFDRNNSRHQILAKEEGEWREQGELELRQLQAESIHSFYPSKILDMSEREGEKNYLALFRNNIGFRDTTTVYHEWLAWVDDEMKPLSDEKLFLDYAEAAVTVRTENSISVSNHPAGYKRFIAYDKEKSRVLIANGETGEIAVQNPDQSNRKTVRLPVEIVPIDSNDKTAYLDNIRRGSGPQAANRANELYLDHEPVIKQFVLADDGTYWIETARLDLDKPDWVVADSTGEIIGSFHSEQISEGVQAYRLHAVRGNKLYGSGWIDEIPNLIISEVTD